MGRRHSDEPVVDLKSSRVRSTGASMDRVRVIDSHTEGEPTRMVVAGGPALGNGSLAERRDRLQREFDGFRRALVLEPRGSDIAIGALLVPPLHSDSTTGVIFFNNVGYLGMCGHGTIGVIVSLAHLGRIRPGPHALETPVGTVLTTLREDGAVSFRNVESRCARRDVSVDVPGYGSVVGDVAWGGNWFYLLEESPLAVRRENIAALTDFTRAVHAALLAAGVRGDDGGSLDHIEVSGPGDAGTDSRNFVLCPGGMYDRSPCGTGTSAKLAALHARGRLRAGQVWRQQGITGGVFEGFVEASPRGVIPTITGHAFVTGEGDLLLDERDPFRHGIFS